MIFIPYNSDMYNLIKLKFKVETMKNNKRINSLVNYYGDFDHIHIDILNKRLIELKAKSARDIRDLELGITQLEVDYETKKYNAGLTNESS